MRFLCDIFLFSAIVTKHAYLDLTDEQGKEVHDILMRQIQAYVAHRGVSKPDEVSGLIEYIEKTYTLALESVGMG